MKVTEEKIAHQVRLICVLIKEDRAHIYPGEVIREAEGGSDSLIVNAAQGRLGRKAERVQRGGLSVDGAGIHDHKFSGRACR